MENVRVTESPISGKILVGSTHGSIMDAIDVVVRYLNDSAFSDRDISFYCDYGGTSVEFPSGVRKSSFTRDEVWAIVNNARGNKISAPAIPLGKPNP